MILLANLSAYRCGHKTETALIRVYNDIVINGSYLGLLDLSAAFDPTDHDFINSNTSS